MKLLAKVGSLALIATVAGGVVAGCSGTQSSTEAAKGEGAANSVGLSLQPVSGVTLNAVHYTVTKVGSTVPVLDGDLPTPGTAKTFNAGLPIPVGTGYTLSLTAVSAESATTTCAGSVGPFDVKANQTTTLNTTLTCTDAANGSANNIVTVATDACPRLVVDYVLVTPNSALTGGGTIAVASKAHDLDAKPLTYAWKIADATLGAFTAATSANTTFTCGATGGKDVVATVTASNGECSKSLTTTVSCVNASCGNKVLDAGEACDPSIPAGVPGFGPCLANCTLAVCGNGKVETPVEQCDLVPQNLGNCSATCQTVIAKCGDGLITTPAEACDGTHFPAGTPANSTCSATCDKITSPVVAVCNDGKLTPPEVCDVPFTVNNCGKSCNAITPTACFTCENDPGTCQDFVSCDIALGNAAAGSPAAGTPKAALCNEVLDCVRQTGCAANGNAPINCYCGTASGADCQAGLGNGLCKTQIERGLETTAFTSISARFKNTGFGGGVALARIDCDQNACKPQCGL